MKLTNSIKESIILAIMNDTPTEYSEDQRDKDATIICVSKMPPKIRELWEDKTTRHWVKVSYVRGFNYLPTGDMVIPELEALRIRYISSRDKRFDLKNHVTRIVNQFTTDKQMRDLLPELDAYIPKDVPKTKNLPAVVGMMAELSKAGFPKGAKSE